MKITYKKILLLCFSMLLSHMSFCQSWNLVWQDEFTNGIGPDWVFETGTGSNGWGNNELQYYRTENATVVNGELVITARNERFGGMNYTSARMKTQGRKSWKYGKIEARIKMPSFLGSWPAFWMLGDNISSVGWPACGEIDLMEHINTERQTHGTIHWQNSNGDYASYTGSTGVASVSDYHIYTIEWDSSAIKWFVDGNLYHEASIANGVNGTSEFHNNFFILLNMAIGGNWPGFNVNNSAMPAAMYVDYVRVYQAGVNPPPTGIATVYQHCSYGGYAIGLDEGNYTRAQLIGLGVKDDDISSLKVQSGYQVTLYFDDNFTGTSITKTADDSCLVDDGFNDQVTSIIVSKSDGGGTSTFIEAESYSNMSGVQLEDCSEGGQNVGYIDTGDWMAYNDVNFPSSGNYRIEYRVASAVGGGILSADLNAGAIVLGQVNIPNTGGWQNWVTVSHTVNINAGTYPLGLFAQSGGWNINWIKITKQSNARSFDKVALNEVDIEEAKKINTATVYPNPFTSSVQFKFDEKTARITVFNAMGRKVLASRTIESEKSIDLSNLDKGLYIISIEKNGIKETKHLIKE